MNKTVPSTPQPQAPNPAAQPQAQSPANPPASPETGPAGPPQAQQPAPVPAAPVAKPPAPAPQTAPQPAQPVPPKVAPPVRPSYRRKRHWLVILSFLVCVMVPCGLAGGYLWGVAADQYVSKVGFSVRKEESNSALDVLGGLSSLSGSSSTDTDILYEFIQSQRLVADIEAEIGLRQIWSRPSEDVVFALKPEASIEELVTYWNRMVRLSYSAGAGLLEVEVRAFTAEEATLIAETLFARSSEMINELSAIARADAIRYAQEELESALDRLKQARATVTRFRNENQLINPDMDLQSQAGLLGNLQTQLAETIIDIDLLTGTTRSGDPRLVQARRRLEVIEARIEAERQKLGFGGVSGNGAFADIVGEYERLVVDREFSEQAYVSALSAYDAARAEARRKSRYLAAYMEPTRAETPEHPQRVTLLFLFSLLIFLIWSVLVLVLYALKDRR